MSKTKTIQVFREAPTPGKFYETAEYTHKTGTWSQKNEVYFTTHTLSYVGKHIKTERVGWGDGCRVWEIFNDKGVEKKVEYSYGGTTCFREVNEKK